MDLHRLRSTPETIAVDLGAGWRPLAGSAVTVDCSADGDALRVAVAAPTTALAGLRLRWPLSVPEGARCLGDAWERGYGDLEWRGLVAERVLPWYALLHADGALHGVGVRTGPAAFAGWQVDEAGITLVLDLRCGGLGVRLGARRLEVCAVVTRSGAPGEDEHAAAHAFCRALCPAPRLPDHQVYGFNDWYYAYGAVSTDSVRRDGDLLRALTAGLAQRPYHVIDAGWSGRDGSVAPWRPNAKFPDLPGLARDIVAKDLRPGIWVRPLLHARAEHAALALATPREARPDEVVIDPSRPEALALVEAQVAGVVAAGFRLVKHDFTAFDACGRWGFAMHPWPAADGWRFADDGRTTAEILLDLHRAIRRAAGDAVVLGCNTVGHLAAGLFEVARTGDDTSGRAWERTRRMGPNTLAMRMPQHGAFHVADADCVGLTAKIPWELNRQWLDVVARSGTALFVSADPAALDDERRAALRRAFALAATPRAPARARDWRATTQPRRWAHADGAATYAWHDAGGTPAVCPG